MSEEEIRMQAQMYALVAEMEAIVAGVKGMEAENKTRESLGHAMAYDESTFAEASKELETIAECLRKNI